MANEMGWTQKDLKKVVVEKRGKKGPRQKVRLSTQYLNGRNRQDKSQDSSLAIYHRGNSHKRSRATKKEKKEEENAAACQAAKCQVTWMISNPKSRPVKLDGPLDVCGPFVWKTARKIESMNKTKTKWLEQSKQKDKDETFKRSNMKWNIQTHFLCSPATGA